MTRARLQALLARLGSLRIAVAGDLPSSWGIIQKQTNQLVGTIGYMDYSEDNASVEVGYSLAHWLWNGGYMTEALRRVIGYTFDAMDINRIEAQHGALPEIAFQLVNRNPLSHRCILPPGAASSVPLRCHEPPAGPP